MKKRSCVIIILVFIITIGGLSVYISNETIDKDSIVFIKTIFSPIKKYDQEGIYFFPEKLLFFDLDAFVRYEISSIPIHLSIPTEIILPLPMKLNNDTFKIKYTLSVTYQLTVDYQAKLLRENNQHTKSSEKKPIDKIKNDFKNWISMRDQDIILRYIETQLRKKKPIQLDYIFEQSKQTLFKENKKKQTEKELILTEITHSIKSIPSIERYEERYHQEKKLEKERLVLKAKSIKEEDDIKASWNKEKKKVEKEIEMLKLYGKLFQEYPETLNYLYLKKLANKVNIIMAPTDSKIYSKIFEPLFPRDRQKRDPLLKSPKLKKPPENKNRDNFIQPKVPLEIQPNNKKKR